MPEDLEIKISTFKDLLAADIFLSSARIGMQDIYLKLAENPIPKGPRYNAVGAHDGKFYLFKDTDKVELHCHKWEWAQGYQVTEKCLECGRPRVKP